MTVNLNAINFLSRNLDSVILILAAILALFAGYRHKSFEGIKQMLFAVVTEAEEKYGPGMGLLKKGEAAAFVWSHIPPAIQLFVSQKDVENLIEKAVEEAKGRWAQNSALKEYVSHNNERVDSLQIPISPYVEKNLDTTPTNPL